MMHVAVDTGRSLLIGGRWEAAAETMPVVNPWSGEALGAVACADTSHVERAVASALRGAEAMRDLSTGERSRILHAAASALAADSERFAAAITAETGKPIRAATRGSRARSTRCACRPRKRYGSRARRSLSTAFRAARRGRAIMSMNPSA
jgi:acyl-CoA reductase-like NAD-dependent aldehyde dehydrogenase